MTLATLATLALLAICVDVNLSPRLQRGDWKAVATAVGRAQQTATSDEGSPSVGNSPRSVADRPIAVVTAHLGSAPLRYYYPALRPASGSSLKVLEIDKVGYKPLLAGASRPPAPGFELVSVRDLHGELLYRFASLRAREVSLSRLRAVGITAGETDVLATSVAASRGSGP